MASGNPSENKMVNKLKSNALGQWGRIPRTLKVAIVVVAYVIA